MDIRCPICAEPWDIDSLHDEAEWLELTFSEMRKRFYSDGCGIVFGTTNCERSAETANAASVASLAHELMGDDVDGIASMLEDAEWMGLLD